MPAGRVFATEKSKATLGARVKQPRRPRAVQIYAKDRNRLLAVRQAESLRLALKGYFEETLQPKGWMKPIYKGNVLSVTDKHKRIAMYVAKDCS